MMLNRVLKCIVSIVLCISILFSFSSFFSVSAATQFGTLTHDDVRVRTSPTTNADNILTTVNGNSVMLDMGDTVTVLETVDSIDDTKYKTWCHIQFTYNNLNYEGYVYSGFVKIKTTTDDYEMPEGVPEIYKKYVESLLSLHPNWKFVFYDTGYEWDDLFLTTEDGQCFPERSLIYKSEPLSYRSTASGNYNWRTDTWIAHDASSWYQANQETIAYYMDPRNFLNENKVFMFETLEYEDTYQVIAGVEGLLKKSFMNEVEIKNQNNESVTYSQAYMDAAVYSKVSPYHLVSRTIQEVGWDGSSSTSGSYSGYEGYYNFYNIGAYAGTSPVANALNFAKNGGDLSSAQKAKYLLPWNSQYKAIVGGASWLGTGYIYSVHKQNTLYFQKFNTSNPNNAFYHQYMQNITAPSSEASTMKKTYESIGLLDNAFTFIIPYYRNMPEEACKLPEANDYSPNNWLSSLKIENFDFGFDAGKTTGYSIEVQSSVSSVNVSATSVNSKAKISGTGKIELNPGSNVVEILVTAENGDKRTYSVNIIRNAENIVPLTGISLSSSSASMFTGDTKKLTVTYKPSNTTDDKAVTWTSSDKSVATVSNGTITAIGVGTATITAKVGAFTATCKVTVSSSTNYTLGDIDADGEITIADALMIFKYKSKEIKLSETALKAADTDKNGEVELADALRIFKFKSEEIEEL